MESLNPLRVAALTEGRNLPSARFRVRQHKDGLAQLGIQIEEHFPSIARNARIPGWPSHLRQSLAGPGLALWLGLKLGSQLPGLVRSRSASITWLQRSLLPGLPSLEGFLKRPLVLDIDDATWLTPPFGKTTLRRIAQRADLVLAGNTYLADFFDGICQQVEIFPSAVDTGRFKPNTHKKEGDVFTFGWIGTAGNLPYLEAIEAALTEVMNQYRDIRLLVSSDRMPRLPHLRPEQLIYIPWSENNEVSTLHQIDVGLMPLPDNPWTRGKCSYKMLQYMACEIPVVVSPVGMNREVLSLGSVGLAASSQNDWVDALSTLYKKGGTLGQAGRAVVVEHFSLEKLTPQLARYFQHLGGQGT